MFDAPRLLLGFSVAMILLICAAALSYDSAWSSPELHTRIGNMEIGGARAAEDAANWLLGLVFGAATILSFVSALLFASGPSRYAMQRKLAIVFGGSVYFAVFFVVMLRYRSYAIEGPSQLGPFSTPTTWMVFGLWIAPAVFVVIYCVKFDTWFGSADGTRSEGDPN